MRFAKIADRVATLGSEKWLIHVEGKRRKAAGEELIFLSIGEPDLPPPRGVLEVASQQMFAGRTRYSDGHGDNNLRQALSQHYTKQTGRNIGTEQFIYLPGTQTALSLAMTSIINEGDEVLLLDPYYATYEGVICAPGGIPVAVPLDPDRGFHPDLDAIARAITPRTRAILLNSPSNPTGAVFTANEIKAIGQLAKKHDLWIVSDEVYATLIHDGNRFVSPFFDKGLEERVIVCSSISKSHGLPGFRGGWIAASEDYCRKAMPVAETMLFSSHQFVQDAVAYALQNDFAEVKQMRDAYFVRGKVLVEGLKASNKISAQVPEGGMFVMVDVRKTGVSGDHFARELLDKHKVVVMPGESFGAGGSGHLRVALTVEETQMAEAARRISTLAATIS